MKMGVAGTRGNSSFQPQAIYEAPSRPKIDGIETSSDFWLHSIFGIRHSDFRKLSHPERNPRDIIPSKTMLQPVENLLAPIPHDLAQPHTAIHRHEQRPISQSRWLRVRHDRRIEQIIPDPGHFNLRSPPIDPKLRQHRRYQISNLLRPARRRFLDR